MSTPVSGPEFAARLRARIDRLVARIADRDTPERKRKIDGLGAILAERLTPEARVLTDFSLRRQYSRDLGEVPPFLARMLFRTTPHLVVQPRSTADVVETLGFAREKRLPVFPRGVASWGFGGAVPTQNGVVIDSSPMASIGALDAGDLTIEVDGGAKWGHIDQRIEPAGLGLMCYPSSRFSTVAGWISTGGFGLTAFGYGHLKNSVAWIELVTAGGKVLRVTESDENFDLLFGSEGQLGLITRVKLKLVARPTATFTHLLYGSRRADLFAFVRKLAESDLHVPMVKYFDAELMKRFNELYRHHAPGNGDGTIVEERDAILVQIDGPEAEERFRGLLTGAADAGIAVLDEAPAHASRYIWHDRYNPLKIQILGPSLLAGELLIDTTRAGAYIDAVKKLGARFKLDVLIESHFLRTESGDVELLLIPMFHSDQRHKRMYFTHVSLIPMLTRLGVRMGGRPYGIGIWNTPFLRDRHDATWLTRLARWKRELDPARSLNPRKFWGIRSRFWGLPGLAFSPPLFRLALDMMLATSWIGGPLTPRRTPPGHQTTPDPLLIDAALKCTNCGNCVAVCPAYQVTKDERTTARLKLRIGHRLLERQQVEQDESDQAWICTRCGECERVCQAELPLLETYDRLEEMLEPRFGRPDDAIRSFVEGLGENKDYLELIGSDPFRSA